MQLRRPALLSLALVTAHLTSSMGCARSSADAAGGSGAAAAAGGGGATPSGGGGTGPSAGGGTGPTAGGGGNGQSGAPSQSGSSATGGDAAGAGGAPALAFDASHLSVVGDSGASLCRLSDDGESLLVTVKNAGMTMTGPTAVQVATVGQSYASRVDTPALDAGQSAELSIPRGPLVGFVDNWQFSVVIDPDGDHSGPSAPIQGVCRDLRSRATAGMKPLATWYDAATGLWNHDDWWTSANQLETVIDYSRESGDPTYTDEIDNTFVKNQAGDFDRFGFYDDDGWWAMAWIKAYDLSHQTKYLDMAKTIFARMSGGWSSQCGGGIYWASAKAGSNGLKNKNAIPNSLFMQVAAKLHQRTPGDTGPGSYLDWAQREWAWFNASGMIGANQLVVDGLNDLSACKPGGPVFTYNQGVLVGALVDLAAASGDSTLLDQGEALALAGMSALADPNGTLKEAPCGGDICTQFKGVFMRNLVPLYRARPRGKLQQYIRHQSDVLWNQNKNASDQFGYEWHLPFDKATASRQSSALDALVAAVATSNMNLALGATASGSAACSPSQSAQNVVDGSSGSDSKWCSGGAGGQTLTLDLGASREIVGFRLRHAGAGGESSAWNTRDFELATSADGINWALAVQVTSNTDSITTHPIPALNARFAQLHITQAQTDPQFLAARIYEFEVFGTGH